MSLEGTTALISDRYLITAEVDSGATVTAGNVVYISAAGYIPKVKATDGVRKDVIGVALTSGTAGKKITVICRGLVRVTVSGAVSAGQRITSWANGAVAGIAAMTAPASYVQATVQTELDKTEQWIGRALTSGTDTVIYALLSCLP
jgi:hypothetical protein